MISGPDKKILRKCCICILILESSALAGHVKKFPISVTKTEEQVLIEQVTKDSDAEEEKTVYGIQILIKEGEIRFYRTLIK